MALPAPSELNLKEQRVIDAYMRAGSGMTMRDAYLLEYENPKMAWRFFQRSIVKTYISQIRQEAADLTGLTEQRTVRELAALAFSNHQDIDYSDLVDHEGRIDLKKLPRHVAAAIRTIKYRTINGAKGSKSTQTITEVTLHPKVEAIDKILRYFGSYQDQNVIVPVSDVFDGILKSVAEHGLPKPGEIIPGEVVDEQSR